MRRREDFRTFKREVRRVSRPRRGRGREKNGFGFRFSGVVGEILPNSSHLRRRREIDRGFGARENVRTESSGRDHRVRLGLFRRELEVRGRD